MQKVNYPDDLEMPNDSFLTHQIVEKLLKIADTKSQIGHTNDILSSKLRELTQEIISKGGKGFFWIVSTPEIVSILESWQKFSPSPLEQIPLGYPHVMFRGIIEKKWRLYEDLLLTKNTLLMGTGFSLKPPTYYGILQVI
jgi:hypothetical protein